MVRSMEVLLAVGAVLFGGGCGLFVVAGASRCDSDGDCPSSYLCVAGLCEARIPADSAVALDARAVDGLVAQDARLADRAVVADVADRDRSIAEQSGHEAATADAASDRPIADGSGDARHPDRGALEAGADSAALDAGMTCSENLQCTTGFCNPATGSCQAPTCGDGYQNQDETGPDCGGSVCPPCPTCWGNAANFNEHDASLVFSTAVDLTGCDAIIDTSLAPVSMLVAWCGEPLLPVVQSQVGGPDLVVVPMASFVLGAGRTLRLIGDKPVVLAVRGNATILGAIDAGARGTIRGAGGDLSTDGVIATANGLAGSGDCNVFAAGTGQGMNHEPGMRSLGGGGAGFRTNGGFGGGERYNFRCYSNQPSYTLIANGYECQPECPTTSCDNSFSYTEGRFQANNGAHYVVQPIRGLAAPDPSLTPLRGGCAGGRGESVLVGTAYYGGSGGGAVQITATGTLRVGAGGIISAGGGGGTTIGDRSSGSGGGSGGAILLEATTIDVSAATGIRAHGGSGGGRENGSCSGTADDGHLSDDVHAMHAVPGCISEGRGGLAYWNTADPSCNGTSSRIGTAVECTLPLADWPVSTQAYPQAGGFTDNNGGGGGGGSGGVIVVRQLALAGACP